jgi:hypothetical protein
LQQGKNIADVLVYYGENTNITWLSREKLPTIPAGYEFDFVNSSALINAIEVKNGRLIAKSGNSYNLLVLDETAKYMTLPVLKRLQELVNAGAKVAGRKPEKSPSLSDNDADFQKIVNEIWSSPNVSKTPISDALKAFNLSEDIIIKNNTSKILYRHRQTADQDIYWLNNRSNESNLAEISFKVNGKIPELWNPIMGKSEKVSYQIKDGRTIIPLKFESWDAYFIVFKDKATANSFTKTNTTESVLTQLLNPWKVVVGNKNVTMDKLTSLTENADADIKYFSGTAIYENTFKVNSIDKSANYLIDLGDVKNIAEVTVNGKNVGTVWKKPFKLNVSEALKSGENTIQVKVTNLWVNRLIGDAQPDVKVKTTFTTMPFYRADSPLLPSGLLSTVNIVKVK